jgi:hypothetical protein
MIDKDWPVHINETCLIGAQKAAPAAWSRDYVRPGKGDRALFCDRYEHCLSLAAVKDWQGFNCVGCPYERKGDINFCFEQFEALIAEFDSEEEILFGNESQIQDFFDYDLEHENVLLTLIDCGIFDQQPYQGGVNDQRS